jgi:ABC-type dipeptide/oligopeptide/nickel transport system permease subunit|tara:strand:+ start:296 stop:1180 length:885 start_codon:yes stop_codon:yes gene_type:complete
MSEATLAIQRIKKKKRSPLREGLHRLLHNRLAMFGALLVILEIGLAIFASVITPYEPNKMDYTVLLTAPSAEHLLGTDELGRDIFTRMMYGARLSLAVGTMAVVLAVILGVPFGLIAGYVGGYVDELLMRVVDSVMALPALVLALTISAVLGSGLINATIAIAVVTAPTYTRLVRGQVLSIKQNDYVEAAHSIGAPVWLILMRHILPNAFSPIIVQASLGIGFAIILESSMSFIGLGAQLPTASWGNMVRVGFQFLELAPWFALAPATAIFLAVLGFNMLGDGLRDALDPQSTA